MAAPDALLQPVILAGGSGTRLWPLSRTLRPKQFLPLLGRGTLLQQTLQRLQGLPCAPAIVVCGEAQRFLAAEQLRAFDAPSACLLLEPVPRNTAPALALAALQATRDGVDPVLIALPADHRIGDAGAFQRTLQAAAELARAGWLATLGVAPTRAETGYGYIRRGAALGPGWQVQRFEEKPDAARAAAYLAAGDTFWNSGIFVLRATRYLQELARWRPDILAACRAAMKAPAADRDFLRPAAAALADCPSESIDYAIMEHTERAAVVALEAGWSDLGAWDALLQAGATDAAGNQTTGDVIALATQGSLLHAEHGLLAAVGVHDLVVVTTADAVLVADRAAAQQVRAVVQRLQDAGRPEVEHQRRVDRPWGSYDALGQGPQYQVKKLVLRPGAEISLQRHRLRSEHWVVVRGSARVTRGERVFMLQAHESVDIPAGTIHRLENPGAEPLEVIEVQSGSYLGEDDIERLADRYGRAGPERG